MQRSIHIMKISIHISSTYILKICFKNKNRVVFTYNSILCFSLHTALCPYSSWQESIFLQDPFNCSVRVYFSIVPHSFLQSSTVFTRRLLLFTACDACLMSAIDLYPKISPWNDLLETCQKIFKNLHNFVI